MIKKNLPEKDSRIVRQRWTSTDIPGFEQKKSAVLCGFLQQFQAAWLEHGKAASCLHSKPQQGLRKKIAAEEQECLGYFQESHCSDKPVT